MKEIAYIALVAGLLFGFYGGCKMNKVTEGRNSYEQGVKDCMNGKATVTVRPDTVITFPSEYNP